MKQDVGFFDVGESCPDLIIEDGDLKADNGLETASLISCFSDKRVSFEELPRGEKDQMGWWADLISDVQGDQIGSRLWVLDRVGKINNLTPIELESILEECFAWTLEDGIAASVVVTSERTGTNELLGTVTITKPDGRNIPFSFVWDGQKLKLFEE